MGYNTIDMALVLPPDLVDQARTWLSNNVILTTRQMCVKKGRYSGSPGSFVPEGRLVIAQRFIAGCEIQINASESRRDD